MTTLHEALKLVDPTSRLPDGRPVAGRLHTERACEAAIDLLEVQARKIERQLAAGPPPALCGDTEAETNWRYRAEMALGHKRSTIANIRMAVELARDARIRQLVGLRLAEREHRQKMERIEKSRHDTETDLARFKEMAKKRLGSAQYDDIWARVRSVQAREQSA